MNRFIQGKRGCRRAVWKVCFCLLAGSALGAEVVRDAVAYYGVDPANAKPGTDAALIDAKNHLDANPSDTLVLYFPAGTYEFNHPSSRGLWIQSQTNGNLVIRGAGTDSTVLRFDQFDQIAILVASSRNVTFEHLHVTRTGLYTTQGEVTGVEPGRIRFRLHEGFPDPVWLFGAGSSENYERTLLAFLGPDLDPEYHPKADKIQLSDMIHMGDGLYEAVMTASNTVPNLVPGDRVALKSKSGHQTFRILNSDDCTIQDVRITRAAGNPIRMPYGGNRMVVRRVVIDRAEPINGRTPFFSGPGGGIQLYANGGGSLVEDCLVVATADDGVAIFSHDPVNLTTNTIVRRNIVRDNQARGILITQSDGGICEHNTLIRNHDSSIRLMIEGDDSGVPSAAVKNWEIRNNTLIQTWTAATIRFNKGPEGSGLHNNIVIKDNLILQASKNCNVIQIEHAQSVLISGNEIRSFSDEEDTPKWGSSDALVQIQSARSVSGGGNIYSGSISRAVVENLNPFCEVGVTWEQRNDLLIAAAEDTFVDSLLSDSGRGWESYIKIGGGAAGLVKFHVGSIPAGHRVVSARLRVMPCSLGFPVVTPRVYACPDNGWSEETIIWNIRPPTGELLASGAGLFIAGSVFEADVRSFVTGNGTYSFYLHSSEEQDGLIASRENGLYLGPELILETEPVCSLYLDWIGGFETGGADGLLDDPDADGLNNLVEYALGGSPDIAEASGLLPFLNNPESDDPEALLFKYRRRRDYAVRGLFYVVELTDDLLSGVWGRDGYEEAGVREIDEEFEIVSNRIFTREKPYQVIRLRVGI